MAQSEYLEYEKYKHKQEDKNEIRSRIWMGMIWIKIAMLPLIRQVYGFKIWHRDEVKDLDEDEEPEEKDGD